MKSYEERPVISEGRQPGAARTALGTVRKDRARPVFSLGQRYLKGLPGCSARAGVLGGARPGEGSVPLVLMTVAPPGSGRPRWTPR